MEKIAHIWNVNQFMTRLNCPQSKNLQTFYLRCCKKLSKGSGLPKQKFGPSAMCVHCNSLWNTVDHEIRVLSARPMSKSVKKIVQHMNQSDTRVPRVRATLGRKAIRRQTNRMSVKCSVCSRITKFSLSKPKRKKIKMLQDIESINVQKHKKKKVRDKTAGLNIPLLPKAEIEDDSKLSQKKPTKRQGSSTNFITPPQKLKKLNITRLKDIVSKGVTPPKSKSLHSFLSEL